MEPYLCPFLWAHVSMEKFEGKKSLILDFERLFWWSVKKKSTIKIQKPGKLCPIFFLCIFRFYSNDLIFQVLIFMLVLTVYHFVLRYITCFLLNFWMWYSCQWVFWIGMMLEFLLQQEHEWGVWQNIIFFSFLRFPSVCLKETMIGTSPNQEQSSPGPFHF